MESVSMVVGRDSAVGKATVYGLNVPGIESCWRQVFPQPSRPTLGAQPANYTMGNGGIPGAKAAGTWRWPLTPI
jgi:hypothetical protein